ncbi:MAG TPA: hypothetical protein VGR91_15955 [Stellaceae bacterium]|nr:hypothetical protein [Stellaceae bacterium]
MTLLFNGSAERQLWCAVVERAMQDAVGLNAALDRCEARRRERQDALNWFVEGGRDYQMACDAAGVDPVHLRHRVLSLASQSGEESRAHNSHSAADPVV